MKSVLVFLLILLSSGLKAQLPDSAVVIRLNQQIDDYVVQRNLAALDTLYADDFVFAHGSGRVEGKAGWLKTVATAQYPLRRHDSVTAELHPGLAVVKGRLNVRRIDKDKTARYHLKYIRVYALRNQRWQMVSHHTYYEFDEP